MGKILKNSWALFAGFAVLITAHGFQGNLLGVRAVLENFDYISTGSLMSGYFIGYFFGAHYSPKIISRVGHIRVFAAFASVASLSSLLHVVFVNPYVWTLIRFLHGFSVIAILIIVESWLNDRANNRNRGKVLSLYMFITFFGFAIGNMLLNFSSPTNYEPFILISLLFSIALIPILLTKRKPPKFKKIGSMSIRELFKTSPFGSISMFCIGFTFSAIFTMSAVYATVMNLSIFDTSVLLVLITLAGALFQWPIGSFSDNIDRRKVIILCAFLAIIFSIFSIFSSGLRLNNLFLESAVRFNYFTTSFDKLKLFIFITLLAGMVLPLFSLILALVNDRITKEKFVSAGAGLNIIFGLGAMTGPLICSLLMLKFGPNGFFVHLILFLLPVVIYGLCRLSQRKLEDNPDSTFTPLPRDITPLGIELDPTTGADLSNPDNQKK